MLYLLRSTGIWVGLAVVGSLAIAPRLMAHPASIPIQVAYSQLDVNAIDLYYSDPVETEDSSDSREVIDMDNTGDESMLEDSSEDTTSLQ
jgi:hypothetical protein